MKSSGKFDLEEKWWKKEAPENLGKLGDKFYRALREFSFADDALNIDEDNEMLTKYELAELAKCNKLLDALKPIAKELASECEKLAKAADKAKDKKRATDLSNTVAALNGAFLKAVAEKKKEYDDLDGHGKTSPLVSPAAHGAYLKRMLPKLKRMTHSFGFALVSNDPFEQRALFHKIKKPKSLAAGIRKEVKPRKLGWGTAGAGDLMPGSDEGAMTLVLNVEGPMVPNLARRLRLMMQAHKISAFNAVKVMKDGVVAEASTEDEPDIPLEEVTEIDEFTDLEDEDEDLGAVPPPPPPPPPQGTVPPSPGEQAAALEPPDAPPVPAVEKVEDPAPKPDPMDRWREVERTMAPRVEQALSADFGDASKIRAVWSFAVEKADSGDPATAVKVMPKLEALLKGFDGGPSAAQEEWEKAEAALSRKVEKALSAGFGDTSKLRAVWTYAVEKAEGGNFDAAVQAIKRIEAALEGFVEPEESDYEKWFSLKKKLYPEMMKMIQADKGDPNIFIAYWSLSEFNHEDRNYKEGLRSLASLKRALTEAEKMPKNAPVNPVPEDPEERAEICEEVLRKLENMSEDLDEAAEALPKRKNDIKTYRAQVRDGAKKDNLPLAYGAMERLERFLQEAIKEGKKFDKAAKQLDALSRDLDGRSSALAKLPDAPALTAARRSERKVKGRCFRLIKRKDTYGALACAKTWEGEIETLEEIASEMGIAEDEDTSETAL